MAPAGNKLHEVAPGDVPEPTPGVRSILSYDPATELRENLPALLLNLLGASGGDWLKLSADLLALEVAPTAPIETSANVADPGRMFVGDGVNVVDDACMPILIRGAAPIPTDAFDGALWWDKVAKLLYLKGKDVVGDWTDGFDPFRVRPTEYFSAEIEPHDLPQDSDNPYIFQAKDIEQVGAFTQDASGITIPVAGSYRIAYNFQVLNNTGFEAVGVGKFTVNGALAPINGREWGIREATSRWPIVSITLRTTLAAGDVIAVDGYMAGTLSEILLGINGSAGGILIERVGD